MVFHMSWPAGVNGPQVNGLADEISMSSLARGTTISVEVVNAVTVTIACRFTA